MPFSIVWCVAYIQLQLATKGPAQHNTEDMSETHKPLNRGVWEEKRKEMRKEEKKRLEEGITRTSQAWSTRWSQESAHHTHLAGQQ